MGCLQPILAKAQDADYEFLIECLRSPINFCRDRELRTLYASFRQAPTAASRGALVSRIEHEIRYAGSSDLMYALRRVFADEAGVGVDEIVRDVARHLKVRLRPFGTPEARLRRLTMAVAERAVLKLSEEQQRELLSRHNVGPELQDEVIAQLKSKGKVAVLPALLAVLGRETVENLVPSIIISVLGPFIGHETAKKLIQALLARFPWWSEWLGPIVWGISGAWLAIDLQGPAYRKTIPALLYCGLISLRDGLELDDD